MSLSASVSRPFSVLRSALALLTIRLILEQICLGLLIFLLFALWLHVPDASVLDLAASVFLALVIIAVAGAGESWLMLRLCGHARTTGKLLRGTLYLLMASALWFAWSTLLSHLQVDDYLRAGYLNSRLPSSLRNFFSYDHIVLWFGWMWSALEWIGTGLIAIFVVAFTAGSRPRRAIVCALRCLSYWIVLAIGAIGVPMLTGHLMEWTPGHGLGIEVLSLTLRLSTVTIVDATLVSFLLAILSACVRRTDIVDPLYITSTGTPDESQPRTVESP